MFIKRAISVTLAALLLSIFTTACVTKKPAKPYSIEEKVQSKNTEFKKCVNNERAYQGLLVFQWKIDSNGKAYEIKTSKDEVKDKELVRCFSKVMQTIKFSTFGLYYKAKVKSYTFVFSNTKIRKLSKTKKK